MDSFNGSAGSAGSAGSGGGRVGSQTVAVKKVSPKQSSGSGVKARKARLVLSSFNPWSVFKISFLLSVVLGVMYVVAVVLIWVVFSMFGILGGSNSQIFGLFSFTQLISFTIVIAIVNVVLMTFIMMISALAYNVSASLVGGVKVVLTDD